MLSYGTIAPITPINTHYTGYNYLYFKFILCLAYYGTILHSNLQNRYTHKIHHNKYFRGKCLHSKLKWVLLQKFSLGMLAKWKPMQAGRSVVISSRNVIILFWIQNITIYKIFCIKIEYFEYNWGSIGVVSWKHRICLIGHAFKYGIILQI